MSSLRQLDKLVSQMLKNGDAETFCGIPVFYYIGWGRQAPSFGAGPRFFRN